MKFGKRSKLTKMCWRRSSGWRPWAFSVHMYGEEEAGSDLDVLVEILRPIDLLELVGAEIYLTEVLGLKVDLVPKRSLRVELRETILKEAVPL